MSTFQQSSADIALMLTTAAGSTLSDSMVSFVGLKPHDGSVSQKNTEVWVITNTSSPFQGRSKVYYDRLDLSQLGNFTFTKNSVDPNVSVYTVLDIIRNMIGVTFTQDDLVDHQVEEMGSMIQVMLEAKPTSLGFTGSYTLQLASYPDISTLFTSNALVGF